VNVLIVEDDAISRKLMFNYLKDYGDCSLTINGLEAVEAFKLALDESHPYDLICMDIMMPKLDGYKAFEEIRNIEIQYNIPKEKAVKVIMTSALNDGKNLKKSFEMGCVAYAGKPINKAELIATIKELDIL
jgi:two-component system chemotaxis response regulator CheY